MADSQVVINDETFDPVTIPDVKSQMVLKAKDLLLGSYCDHCPNVFVQVSGVYSAQVHGRKWSVIYERLNSLAVISSYAKYFSISPPFLFFFTKNRLVGQINYRKAKGDHVIQVNYPWEPELISLVFLDIQTLYYVSAITGKSST